MLFFRKLSFGHYLLTTVFFGVVVLFFSVNASANSISKDTAYRAAETALKIFLEKIENPTNKDKVISSLGSCSDGIIRGKNSSGEYEAKFLNASGVKLSCSEKFSKVVVIEVTGFFGGQSVTLRSSALSGGNVPRCTGTLPDHSIPYSDDSVNVSVDMSWKYASPNTSRKCEFRCESGYPWDNGSCGDEDDGNEDEYVTTGSENQTKIGAFGVRGAFSAYGGIDAGGKKIQEVATPTDGSDIATKAYVDEAIKNAFGNNPPEPPLTCSLPNTCESALDCETVASSGTCSLSKVCCAKKKISIDPLNPKTRVLVLSSHLDDELIWFEPWLHIADTIMTPVTYAITPYQEAQIGLKYLNTASWVLPQGKLDDEELSEYRAHNRDYRKMNLTDQYISSLVEDRMKTADVVVTHSPWGEYGHEQHRQIFCVTQALAVKYKKDLYIWNGMPDEANKSGGMPASYHTLRRSDGSELPFVLLEYHRNHYDAARDAFRQAELNYSQYHNGTSCDPETNALCNYWTWDRTWSGAYGTYTPPTTAKYYKMVDRGDPIYEKSQQQELLHMRPYLPDESVFGRRDCLTD